MIDTKSLREKILDLAMRGKLVQQNPNDEPASELLKRIKEEKEELINQKKIKRDKNESVIFRGDDGFYYEKFANEMSEKIVIPYEIPQNWSWCRIVTATKNISAGGDKPKEVSKKRTDEFPYPIFSNGIKDKGLYGYSKEAKIFEKSVTVSARGTIGFTAIRNEPYTPIVRLISIIPPQEKLDVEFLQYMLSYLIPVGEGTSIPQLTVPGLKPFLIALPPYQEQLRIVAAINEYFILIDKIEENQNSLISLSEQLKKKILDVVMQGKIVPHDSNDEPASVLLEKIHVEKQKLYEEGKLKKKDLKETIIIKDEDNVCCENIPENWIETSFGSVVQLISGRDLKPNQYSDESLLGIPYITGASNFSEGNIKTLRYTLEPQVISIKGDILISVKGTIGELGINPYQKAHIARQIMAIRPYLLDSQFIQKYLYTKVDELKNSSQSMIPGISRDVLLNLNIIIPPLNEQARINYFIDQIQKELAIFQ